MDTQQLKEFTGSDTIRAAKITLGWRLSLVYSAAYDTLDEVCAYDTLDRWRVMQMMEDDTYKVMRWKRAKTWEEWTVMSMDQAIKYVQNPVIVMLQSNLLDGYRIFPWADRVVSLDWIDPDDLERLKNEATDAEHSRWVDALSNDSKLKKIEWKNLNKMILHTGHVTFDNQTNALGTGNYWANTLHGDFIRPYIETFCNGHRFEPGSLQESDLGFYKDIGTPKGILNVVRKEAREKDVIFYALFHWSSRGARDPVRIIHGYVMTDIDYRLLRSWNTGPSYKSYFVIDGCLPYIAWADDSKGE